ncbi:MAG: DUF1080 domain-containing protein [Sedimentisphaerales bacterium]|nr:DUF1080 domain-containing protein [Sedimentisphaerales bacterium]
MRAYLRGRMTFVVTMIVVVCLAAALTVSVAEEARETPAEEAGGNSKCYVCHATLKTEDITVAHLEMDITCDQCHGPSIEHMHDEMLMTEPDLLFGRSEVRKMCSDPSCHAPGEGRTEYGLQDHKDPAKVQEFHDEWLGRTRPNGRAIMKDPVCTDCHGTHNLDEPLRGDEEEQSDWVSLFNGTDLKNWNAVRPKVWRVQRGRLVGQLAPGAKPASLLTAGQFDNYLLAVTFRADWPVRGGIWIRHTTDASGPRVEIFDSPKPLAFTGSISLPGKGLALTSLQRDLTDRESWNTLSIKVEGPRTQVWLNGAEIGAACAEGPQQGRIGLYLESNVSSKTEIQISEILVKKLPKPEADSDEASAK